MRLPFPASPSRGAPPCHQSSASAATCSRAPATRAFPRCVAGVHFPPPCPSSPHSRLPLPIFPSYRLCQGVTRWPLPAVPELWYAACPVRVSPIYPRHCSSWTRSRHSCGSVSFRRSPDPIPSFIPRARCCQKRCLRACGMTLYCTPEVSFGGAEWPQAANCSVNESRRAGMIGFPFQSAASRFCPHPPPPSSPVTTAWLDSNGANRSATLPASALFPGIGAAAAPRPAPRHARAPPPRWPAAMLCHAPSQRRHDSHDTHGGASDAA